MPIYEYRCNVCGAILEELRRVDDPNLWHCGQETTKLISCPAFTPSKWGDSVSLPTCPPNAVPAEELGSNWRQQIQDNAERQVAATRRTNRS